MRIFARLGIAALFAAVVLTLATISQPRHVAARDDIPPQQGKECKPNLNPCPFCEYTNHDYSCTPTGQAGYTWGSCQTEPQKTCYGGTLSCGTKKECGTSKDLGKCEEKGQMCR